MKKIITKFFMLCLLGISVFFLENVYAKATFTVDYICTYKFKIPSGIALTDKNNDTFTFQIYVDTTTGKIEKNINNTKFPTMTEGGFSIATGSSFNKFYELSKTSPNRCPDAFAVQEGTIFQIEIGNSAANSDIFPLTSFCANKSVKTRGDFCGASENSENAPKTVEYCERTKKSRNNSFDWYFKFYDVDGVRMYSIGTSKNEGTVSAKASDPIGIDGAIFYLEDAIADKLYSSECKNVELYLRCPSSDNMTITNTKPNASENCAYGVNSADKNDNGQDADHGVKTKDNNNGNNTNNNDGSYKCEEILGNNVMEDIKTVMKWIRIIAPILVIVLGTLDFAQAVISNDQKELSKATAKFVKRLIAAVALFFAPMLLMYLIEFALNLINSSSCDIRGL